MGKERICYAAESRRSVQRESVRCAPLIAIPAERATLCHGGTMNRFARFFIAAALVALPAFASGPILLPDGSLWD